MTNPTKAGVSMRVDLPFIEGGLGYPVDDVTTTHEGTAGHAPRRCRIYDARPIVNQLSLDREGFVLVEHESELARQADYGLLRREHLAYLDELTPVIKDVMDASWVVARQGGVVVRSATKLDPVNPVYTYNKGGIEVPYPNVHLDYNFASAVQLARGENYQQGLADRPFSRLVVLQAWRAISPHPKTVLWRLWTPRLFLPRTPMRRVLRCIREICRRIPSRHVVCASIEISVGTTSPK